MPVWTAVAKRSDDTALANPTRDMSQSGVVAAAVQIGGIPVPKDMLWPQETILMLTQVCLAFICAFAAGEPTTLTSESGNIAVQLSANGGVAAIRLGPNGEFHTTPGFTEIGNAVPTGEAVRTLSENGAVTFRRTLADDKLGQSCTVVERFSPQRDSIRWEVEIAGESAFSAKIVSRLQMPVNDDARFWTAWSDPLHSDEGWHDPMEAQPPQNRTWYYGAPAFTQKKKKLVSYCPLHGDTFCMPVATLLYPAQDQGISLVLSPDDALLDLELRTAKDGGITFVRLNHRIGKDRPVRFAMDLVAHPADPRAALGWMAARYPEYFEPPLPAAHDIAGCGAYSAYEGDLDAEKFRKMAFRVNWKASFDFPYMGMFMPPVPGDDDRWFRFNDKACGQPLPQEDNWSSVARMRAYSEKMRGYGFYVLNYFNVTEFGVNLKGAAAVTPGADKDPDAWRNANDFTYTRVADGVLSLPNGGYWNTWGAAVAMDPGGPDYQKFLLDQARRHVEKLPASSGVCIDRMDWLRMANPNADDGESWVDGKPCRLLYTSWRDLMPKLAPIFHDAGKFVFVNNHLKRIDLLRHVDGIYCEFADNGRALNATGLLTLHKPAIGWTVSVDTLKPDPDGFFQRYMYMGVFPTVPLSGNDHTIVPSEWADKYYLDYGPMLDAMRGKHWVLQAHVVAVENNAAKANLFAVPGGFAMPVTFGGDAKGVTVVLRGLPVGAGTGTLTAEAMYPGAEAWTRIGAVESAPKMRLNVPLQRGCAMVRLTPQG